MDRIPDTIQIGVVFRWANADSIQCHWKVLHISEDRKSCKLVVVKVYEGPLGVRFLGEIFYRDTQDFDYNGGVIIIHSLNYKKPAGVLIRGRF